MLTSQELISLMPWVAVLYGTLVVVFSRNLSGFVDALNIHLIYLSFAVVGVFALGTSGGMQNAVLCLLIVWLISFVVGVKTFNCIKPMKLIEPSRPKMFDSVCLFVIAVVYFSYGTALLKNGISSGVYLSENGMDERFRLFEDSKFLFYFFASCSFLPAVFVYKLAGRISGFRFLIYIFPFWVVQLLTLSKTGILFGVIQYAIYRSCLFYGGGKVEIIKPLRLLFYSIVFIMALGGIMVLAEIIGGGLLLGLRFFFNRLFLSYDSLIYLGEMPSDLEPNLSLLGMYFAPYLKVLGLFDAPYNASNYFLAVRYFGYDGNYSGMLPNNNNVMELILGFPFELRLSVVVATAFAYGAMYSMSTRIVTQNSFLSIVFAIVFSTPLGFLVDGQGWFLTVLNSFFLMFLVILIYAVLTFLLNSYSKRGAVFLVDRI